MNDQMIGLIRTVVQALAGWATSQAFLRWGVDVDHAALELVLFGIATGLYRSAISALSHRWPILEWANGWGKQPAYAD